MSSGMTEFDHMMSGNNLTPWHRVGTVIKGLATADEAIKHAKLDWEVSFDDIFDADMKVIEGYKRVYRKDINKTFGIVSPDFRVMQNRRLAELVEPLVATKDTPATFETAGSLFSGETVYFLLNLRDFKLANGEHQKSYLAMFMGHGGKKAITAMLTNVRIVCRNTLNLALGEGDRLFKKKHTKNVEANVIDELRILATANARSADFEKVANRMLQKPITIDEARKFVDGLYDSDSKRTENVKDEVLNLFRNGKGNSGKTLWDLFNGVTEYVDHYSSSRVTEGKNGVESKANSVLFGAGQKKKDEAYSLALKML